MKIIISGNGDIGLYEIDLNKKSFQRTSHCNLNQSSFLVSNKDEDGNIFVYTYTKSPLALVSYGLMNKNNKLELIDKINIPGSSLSQLYYEPYNNRLYGCSYMNGSYMYIDVVNGIFTNYRYIEKTKPALCYSMFKNEDEDTINIIDFANDNIVSHNLDLICEKTYELPEHVGPRYGIYYNKRMYILAKNSKEILVLDNNGNILNKVPLSEVSNKDNMVIVSNYLYVCDNNQILKYKIDDELKLESNFIFSNKVPSYIRHYSDDIFVVACKESNKVSIIDMKSKKEILNIDFKWPECIDILI